ncbi:MULTISPECIES: SpoIIE family protein phosphatase [unclassified Leptolyngbya]|uniref:SpoIIE family protein phosphatase n=1 Tax=unclassified Leptolyngbya TaxID=2650499 RepID=UPI0016822021|nr:MULTISPECIES: SpoIIE family protein phosphatase [unclassified Leptolyngbya]MBD1912800.1 SpoIIE family protein phosphatase [Leptolyngbya sp. FACHB-8]MBD2157747.1 SpoIIE family protein phosphatase [Leptolyngbya sp. FACHB-16]
MPRLSRPSLRFVLIVPFVLQIFGTVGLVGILSFRNGQRAVNDLASQLRGEIAARIEQQLRSYVNSPFLLNQINVSAMQQGSLNMTRLPDAYPLWQQARTFPATNLIYCGRESDGAFMGVGRPNVPAGQDTFEVQTSNASTNYLFRYSAIDTEGNVDKVVRRGDRPYDPRVRPWYKAAQETKQPVWSDIYLDFDARVPVITASQPVFERRSGQFLGVCAVDFLLSQELDTFLSQLNVGKTGETFILERSGTVISSSSSTEEDLLVGEDDNLRRIQAVQSKNPTVRATAQFLEDQFGTLARIQEPQQLSFTREGEGLRFAGGDRQFVQVTPFQDGKGLDWLIVVVIPESDFMAQIQANTYNTVLLCFGALGLATGLGILTARQITRPILNLSTASQILAAKASSADLGKETGIAAIKSSGIAEIESLAQSFEQMAHQLQDAFLALETTNEALEDRVEQRTQELQVANSEITKLNQQLQAENLRMGAELEVARQMQQMILPREHELTAIADLDIAGFMEVATEVGGDYYDIICNEGRVTVGIGDVTGHGLQSGVLMIMVQTAVRTLLATRGEDLPQFLNLLNQVIYENAQRLSPGKNLTLTLLDYRDGQLHVSGQHEEVLVVRANGELKRLDTIDLGFPLGMVSDIREFVAQTQIHLEPGDGVVLYTDGITEAENADRQFYGIDRLITVVKEHWDETSQLILETVLEDVRSHIGDHTIFDDLTLIVLKKKLA